MVYRLLLQLLPLCTGRFIFLHVKCEYFRLNAYFIKWFVMHNDRSHSPNTIFNGIRWERQSIYNNTRAGHTIWKAYSSKMSTRTFILPCKLSSMSYIIRADFWILNYMQCTSSSQQIGLSMNILRQRNLRMTGTSAMARCNIASFVVAPDTCYTLVMKFLQNLCNISQRAKCCAFASTAYSFNDNGCVNTLVNHIENDASLWISENSIFQDSSSSQLFAFAYDLLFVQTHSRQFGNECNHKRLLSCHLLNKIDFFSFLMLLTIRTCIISNWILIKVNPFS